TVVYAPAAALTWPAGVPSAEVLGSLAALGVLCTAIAFVLFFQLIAEVGPAKATVRSEEHTSELQSLTNLVCRLLLEKKNRTCRPRSSKRTLTKHSGSEQPDMNIMYTAKASGS